MTPPQVAKTKDNLFEDFCYVAPNIMRRIKNRFAKGMQLSEARPIPRANRKGGISFE